jgi:hypothetical protein
VRSFHFLNSRDISVACGPKTTLYSAAVASPLTVRMAHSCGLTMDDNYHLELRAGLHANIKTLMALSELGMPLSSALVEAVALSGRLDVLQHLLAKEQCCSMPSRISYYAARSGSISMLKWLQAEGIDFNYRTCEGAANAGQLATLQFLQSEDCGWNRNDIAVAAAEGGSHQVVDWLQQEQRVVISADVMAAAASAGQIAMCKHLYSIGCEWSADACTEAVKSGHLATLQGLRDSGCPWDFNQVFIEAACHARVDILDYVIVQGEPPDAELLTDTLYYAGLHDQLQAVQWLRQHGAQWPDISLFLHRNQHIGMVLC